MGKLSSLFSLLSPVFCLLVSSASAHEMNIFVQRVEGQTIQGKVYFKDGAAAQDIEVLAADPAGATIGTTRTDAEGLFAIKAQYRCDHTLTGRTADGHETRKPAVVKAAQLSADLPLRGDATAAAPVIAIAPAEGSAAAPQAVEALSAQLDQVREQLDRLENTTRFRDILGGIGYILGLSGIAFYLLARRAAKTP